VTRPATLIGVPGILTVVSCGWAYAFAQFAALSTYPAESLAGAAVAVAMLLAVTITVRLATRLPAATDSARLASTLRDHARRGRVSRQLDPDAAGRPRPRAPAPPRVDQSLRAPLRLARGGQSAA
jgi:hypothetical protein